MNLQKLQDRINELMSIFVHQVKGFTAMGRTDINKIAETILVPLLAEVYGYTNLKNLNSEDINYPGIDLADDTARVAFQITSTPDSEKVKKTLRKFIEYKLYEKYDHLIIYILTEKQKSYSGSGYGEIINGKFTFDKDKDIRDYSDILREISNFQIDSVSKVVKILEDNFTSGNFNLCSTVSEAKTEKVCLGLQELYFPEKIYIADLAIDRNQIILNSKESKYKRKLNQRYSIRDLVKATLEQRGLKFGVDWVCHENKLITFHNLSDRNLSISQIIDVGTITCMNTEHFYQVSENYQRIFKSLLGCCMQQKLSYQSVYWQHQEKMFIFMPKDKKSEKRIEEWASAKKKSNKRTVYEREMKSTKPDEISYCKHFAFRTEYYFFGNQWYVSITPNWFFSYDGYKKSFYAKNKIDWLKKKENNRNVFNHVKFVAYFLKQNNQSYYCVKDHSNSFLSFGELVTFENSPILDDDSWRPKKLEEDCQEG